ncbi:MAG TPA: hypothetical protein VFO05_11915 [Candidatus Limnocylindrales bacterium]|nr:hypothetical protein [Candidatus Limnocylindrales bacterium]
MGDFDFLGKTPDQLAAARQTRLVGLLFLGLLTVPAFAVGAAAAQAPLTTVAIGLLVAAGSALAGALLGFLFGLPRSIPESEPSEVQTVGAPETSLGKVPPSSGFGHNTNLEEISDWLTKIIVGVSLIQLGELAAMAQRLGATLKVGFGGASGGDVFGVALVVTYLLGGFLISYTWTRVGFLRELRDTEKLLRDRLQGLRDELREQLAAVRARTLAASQMLPDIEASTELARRAAASAASDSATFRVQRRAMTIARFAGELDSLERSLERGGSLPAERAPDLDAVREAAHQLAEDETALTDDEISEFASTAFDLYLASVRSVIPEDREQESDPAPDEGDDQS